MSNLPTKPTPSSLKLLSHYNYYYLYSSLDVEDEGEGFGVPIIFIRSYMVHVVKDMGSGMWKLKLGSKEIREYEDIFSLFDDFDTYLREHLGYQVQWNN